MIEKNELIIKTWSWPLSLVSEAKLFFSASRADYFPFQNMMLSQWVRDCYNGNLRAIKSQLATDPTLLEKRESVLRLSGLFHVISGARTINPTHYVADIVKAQKSKDMGKGSENQTCPVYE